MTLAAVGLPQLLDGPGTSGRDGLVAGQGREAAAPFAERRPTYAVDDVIHWGGTRSFPVGATIASFVQTDDGFVYATIDGQSAVIADRTVSRCGKPWTTGAPGLPLLTSVPPSALAEAPARGGAEMRPVSGGLLLQQRDAIDASGDSPENWTLACGKPADEKTLADLEFAWRAIRAVKSNAILLANEGATVGVGMGLTVARHALRRWSVRVRT